MWLPHVTDHWRDFNFALNSGGGGFTSFDGRWDTLNEEITRVSIYENTPPALGWGYQPLSFREEIREGECEKKGNLKEKEERRKIK